MVRRRGETGPRWGRSALVLGAIAVVIGGGILLQSLRTGGGARPAPRPPFAAADGAVTEGSAGAKVAVREYGDFQCPHCRVFQLTVGPTIRRLVNDGTIRFSYVPMAFIGSESDLASNAAYCGGSRGFWALHEYLFAHQAPENSGALTAATLTSYGSAAGVSGPAYAACVRAQTYVPFVQRVTDLASGRGVDQTPTLFIDGRQAPASAYTPAGFAAAVRAAAST